jgi:hypothetical protein
MSWLDKYKKDKFKRVEPQNVQVQSQEAFYPSTQPLPNLPPIEQPKPLPISPDMTRDVVASVIQSIPIVQDEFGLREKLKVKLQDIHIENIVNQKLEAALKSLL